MPADTAHKQGKEIVHALSQTACLTFAAVIADGAILQQMVFSAGAISGKCHAGQCEGCSTVRLIPRGQLIQQEEVKKRIKFLCQIRIFTQYFQIIHSYFLQFCLRLISHCFPSSASTVFMAAELNLHCRKSCSIRANTSGKHSISS